VPDQMPETRGTFLSAEWRDLVMLNYRVDGESLRHLVPRGTELDSFGGATYVSLVGFRFCRTRLFGALAIPFHSDFDEVNLRFYVRRKERGEVRRGVVFIAEVVPKWAIAKIARVVYGENYVRLPMRHSIHSEGHSRCVEFAFRLGGEWNRLHARSAAPPKLPEDGSLEQFITEHYWGYCSQRDGGSVEYRVTHVPWEVAAGVTAEFEGDPAELYGEELAQVLRQPPDSAFLAGGSPVVVHRGVRIA